MRSIGIPIPTDSEQLEVYLEDTFHVRQRLLANLPSARYARLHFERGIHYVKLTNRYIASLRR